MPALVPPPISSNAVVVSSTSLNYVRVVEVDDMSARVGWPHRIRTSEKRGIRDIVFKTEATLLNPSVWPSATIGIRCRFPRALNGTGPILPNGHRTHPREVNCAVRMFVNDPNQPVDYYTWYVYLSEWAEDGSAYYTRTSGTTTYLPGRGPQSTL